MPPPDTLTAVDNAAKQALQALALLYRECHRAEPDGPLCDAVKEIMSAVTEIEQQVVAPGEEGGAPAAPQPATPQSPPGNGGSFDQASADTQAMMQAAAAS